MAKKPKSNFLGVFPQGEIPFALSHTYKNDAKPPTPIDLSTFTEEARIDGPVATTNYLTGVLAIDGDPTTGKVGYIWSGAEFQDVGAYEMIVWVGDGGTNRLGSDLFKWEVYDAPGTVPTV